MKVERPLPHQDPGPPRHFSTRGAQHGGAADGQSGAMSLICLQERLLGDALTYEVTARVYQRSA